MEVAAQANPAPGMAEQYMHKNRLQEYAQRAAIPLPIYQTINEGSPHAPQFRSTVVIDGATFSSSLTFAHRKAAEQDVARLALEGISRKIKHEGIPLIQNDTVFCKSILYEYAVKMNLDKPMYTTSQSEGLLPMFVASVVFAGRTYTGHPGRTKKEAEQLGARAVIGCILGSSNSRTLMSQIIKSKGKLYAAVNKDISTSLTPSQNVTLAGPVKDHSTSTVINEQGLLASVTSDKLPDVVCSDQFPNTAAEKSKDISVSLIHSQNVTLAGPVKDHSTSTVINWQELLASVTSDKLPDVVCSDQSPNTAAEKSKDSSVSLIHSQNVTLAGPVEDRSTSNAVNGREFLAPVTSDNLLAAVCSDQLPNAAAVKSIPSIKGEENTCELAAVCSDQLANAAAVKSFPPIKEEENVCEPSSGEIGSVASLGNPVMVSTSKGPNTDEPNPSHFNQVVEIASVSQPVLPSETQDMLLMPSNRKRRSHKKVQGESRSKRTRAGEQ